MTTQTPGSIAAPARGHSRHRGPPPEASGGNLRISDWLYRSKPASVLWLAARVWLGYGWLNAGYQKLRGRLAPAPRVIQPVQPARLVPVPRADPQAAPSGT
jgi:hypothetical protein